MVSRLLLLELNMQFLAQVISVEGVRGSIGGEVTIVFDHVPKSRIEAEIDAAQMIAAVLRIDPDYVTCIEKSRINEGRKI